ncbi:TPA: hypothetical protein KDZ30_004541 [Vibrio alginolyticus]|uniref:hypothetical protein n=1 Tax=Vibrio parahaemolyticus TaxID=670 RepID=UPI00111E65D7|nr:hypothetical protein [Vibrio parahaemolyticus]TOD30368.1 hypothetical protein CGJ66_23080 [Vibrio parahaemolyticus]HBC3525987.1 hypothetical protein [Vibrio alginolyticus]
MSETSIISDLVPFGSAFLGAGTAYLLGLRKDRSIKFSSERAVVVRNFFVLKTQFDELLSLKKTYVVPVMERPGRFIEIPWSLNSSGLSFELETGVFSIFIENGSPKAADLIVIAQNRHKVLRDIHAKRNEYIKLYYAALENRGHEIFTQLTHEQIKDAFGLNNLCQLYNLSETFITRLDDAIISLYAALTDYSEFIENRYSDKNMRFLRYKLLGDNELLVQHSSPPKIQSMEHLAQIFS